MFRKIYPYLVFFIVAYIIWWSPDFWRPDTYFDFGDSYFPFQPAKTTAEIFYTWKDLGNEGFGSNYIYIPTLHLFYFALMAFLKILCVPLWISNRLFFIIPTLAILFSYYYMILSFIDGKCKRIGAVLGSIFFATSHVLLFFDPKIHLAVAGMALSFGGLKRFVTEKRNYHIVIFSFGFLLMTSMPRYIYTSIIFMGFFLVCWCIIDSKSKFKYNLGDVIKLLGIGIVLIILLNFYTFLQAASFLFGHHSSEFMPSEYAFLQRINLVDFLKNISSLFYSIRLMSIGRPELHRYFSSHFNLLVSFLIVGFLFIHLVISKKISKGYFCIMLTSFAILLWMLAFGTDFYKYLMRAVPGFWIVNNPLYILTPLALMYSILLAYSTVTLLNRVDYGVFSIWKKKMFSAFIVIGVSFLIVINNGSYFSHHIPDFRKVFTREGIISNRLGNHYPYFKIPEEYKTLEGFLPEEDKNARVFVLPFVHFGYIRYSWWSYTNMSDILFRFTSLRLSGISAFPPDWLASIKDLIKNKQYETAIKILKFYDYKYIFIHKDMAEYGEEIDFYLTGLSTVNSLETVLDTECFRLYKIKSL